MISDASTHEVVAEAKALAPLIREYQEEMESLRRLSDPVVQGLANAGIFRAYYPRSIGGLEVSPLTFMEAIEELSRADGSTSIRFSSFSRFSNEGMPLTVMEPKEGKVWRQP